jgi:predicted ATPase/DNA-binding SARP family transcriptional activator
MGENSFRLQLLGQFDLQIDSKSVGTVPKQAQELLARLAVSGSRGADRSDLAASLWPEADSERAQFYLRRCLTQLRSLLEAERSRLETTDERRISLNLTGAWCDLAEFERLSKRSETKDLITAVSLFTGDLLAGLRSDWCRQMREVYKERQLGLLGKLAAMAEESGDLRSANEWLAQSARLDPVREETVRHLMRILRAKGEYAAIAQAFRDLRSTMRQSLGLSPSRETVDLYRELLADARLVAVVREEAAPASVAAKIPPPTPTTPFIGRQLELAELGAQILDQRLITIVGLGGLGKSRLAIQIAASTSVSFEGGVAYSNLSATTAAAEVSEKLARALGVSDLESGLDGLSKTGSGKVLLLLDNAEQVAEICGALLSSLLTRVPGLNILCTSQVPLRCYEEQPFHLLPMRLPVKDEDPIRAEAVSFFLSCALRAAPAFKPGPANLDQVVELCRRLDGLPLALELAAVRLRTLPIREIVSNLDDRFALLDQSRGAQAGPGTLRGVLEWSLRLLSDQEAKLFTRLGVFPATWTMAAAQAICSDAALSSREVFGALTLLVDHSLVIYETTSSGGLYRMLETVRSYSRNRLESDSELLSALLDRHANYYLSAPTSGPSTSEDQAGFVSDEPNYSLAIETFLSSPDLEIRKNALRLVNRLFPHWAASFNFVDSINTSVRVIDRFDDSPSEALAEALFRTAGAASSIYKMGLSNSLFIRAETMADALGLEAWSTESVRGRAEVAANEGRLEEAERLLRLAFERYRAADDLMGQAHCLGSLGYIKREANHFEEARMLTESALAISTAQDDLTWRLWCLGSLAAIHIAAKAPDQAIPILLETLAHQEREGNVPAQMWNRTTLGVAFIQSGQLDEAERFLNLVVLDADSGSEDLRNAWPMIELGDLHRLTGRFDSSKRLLEQAFRTSRASGSVTLEARALLRLAALGLDTGDAIGARAYLSAAGELLEKIQAPQLLEELREIEVKSSLVGQIA